MGIFNGMVVVGYENWDVRQIPFLCTQISQPGYGVVYIYNTLALALSRIKDYSYANVLK